MATFYIQLQDKLLQISGELTAENISKALGYVPVSPNVTNELSQKVDNITFDSLKDNPFLQDGSGELNIVDEAGNIIAKIDVDGIHSVDFIAGEHRLSDKTDKTYVDEAIKNVKVDLTGYATEEYVNNIDFYNINNNPIVNNGDGKLLFVDENGYIGLQLEENGLYVKDVIADGHTLSQKADKSELSNYATKDEVSNLVDMSVVTELQGKVNTLIDTDADKSVRDIAVDVLTETLVSETATEAYDTLAEMSAWIKSHPEDASAMNTAIQKNATDITNLDVAYKAADAKVLTDAQEYTDNINFYTIKDNPIVDGEAGSLTFVDETGYIGLQFSNNTILVNDVITPEHTLSSKADKSFVEDNYYNKPTIDKKIVEAITSGQISLDGYATEQWVNEQGFLKNHQDISHLVTKEEMGEINKTINENEEVTANALIELQQKSEKILEISWVNLKELKDNGELKQGMKYRIVDYVTTTSQDNTISANHPFDLIVKALSTNTLSEDVNAIIHDGDTYFNNNKLESWTIKYCLENDTTRFKWANVNGKGVIYYLKDEFNNEAWYDFKNIQFLRNATWLANNSKFTSASGLTTDTYFFTFSRLVKGVVYDDSLYTTKYHATDNHLGRDTAKTTKLNNTIFIDKENNGVFNNIIADGHGNNTFGQSIWNNTIGHNFKDNIINKSFQYNAIGERFEKNQCYGHFIYCNVEAYCVNNRFNGNVSNCTFGQTYYYNNFTGDTLSYCTFGSNVSWVSDMPSMTNVEFSNKCVNGSSSIYLNNLTLDKGGSVLSALNALNGESKSILHKLDNGNYTLFSYSIDKVVTRLSKNVYDLGDFASSKEAEDAASNPNIATKKDILMMHYTVSSANKSGIIRQQVGNLATYQYIVWDGVEKRRVLRFVQLGSDISLIEKGDWEELYIYKERENEFVNTTSAQTINGDKTFNGIIYANKGININNKSFITNAIDSGEFKVFRRGNSSYDNKGFIIRTINPGNNIPSIEMLSTNNYSSYNYLFPSKSGTVALTNDLDSLKNEINNNHNEKLSGITDTIEDVKEYIFENEKVTANALAFLNDNYEEVKNELDNLTVDSLIHITYDELVTLRNNAELIGGMKYRIIDYVTTTSQPNTQSANHQFDIIVEALSEDTLSENAKSCLHDGDTYFSENNAKLEAWELKYCLDNDTSRFAWAAKANTVVNSKNVNIIDTLITDNEFNEPFLPDYYIYIDTAGNNFNRYVQGDGMRDSDFFIEYGRETSPDGLENQLCIYKNDLSNEDYLEGGAEEGIDYADKFFYWGTEEVDGIIYDKWRKSEVDSEWNITEDGSNVFILTQRITTGEINLVEDYNNGKGVIYYMKDEFNNECPYDFKNIKFYHQEKDNYLFTFSWVNENGDVEDLTLRQDLLSDDGIAYGTHNNIIKTYYSNQQILNDITFVSSYLHDSGLFYGCHSNSFGNDCHSNSFGDNCNNNNLGDDCSQNNFGDGCYSNSFGNACYSNSLDDNCYFNSFCNGCYSNGLSDDCFHNSFGNACYSNSLSNNCTSNSFGNTCYSNSLSNNCTSNSFGNDYTSNRLGNRCNSNSFGNGCHSNSFDNGCRNNSFGDSCYFNSFANDCISNSLGNNCNNNSFGEDCNSNSLGNTCNVISLGDNCRNNKFGNNCLRVKFTIRLNEDDLAYNIYNNQLGNSCEDLNIGIEYGESGEYLQNIVISSGLSNAEIGLDCYNCDYETRIARNSKGEIKIYCEADLIG